MGDFALYAPVIVAAAVVAALLGDRLRRLEGRGPVVAAVLWLALHVAAGVAGWRSPWVTNVVVLGTAATSGALLGRSLRSAGALVALAVTAAVVDVASFSGGPTRWLLDADGAGRAVLRYLAVVVPVGGGVVPVVGIGDLLLFAAFFVSLRGLGRRAVPVLSVLCAGLLAALAVGLWRGGAFGIPFMAAGVLLLARLGTPEPDPGDGPLDGPG